MERADSHGCHFCPPPPYTHPTHTHIHPYPQANPERVKQQLLAEGVELEEYGGDVQVVQTAATAGLGLAELEEALLLQAEVMELAAASSGAAQGLVVEAQVGGQHRPRWGVRTRVLVETLHPTPDPRTADGAAPSGVYMVLMCVCLRCEL